MDTAEEKSSVIRKLTDKLYGGKEYSYTLEIYKEDWITRTSITPAGQ